MLHFTWSKWQVLTGVNTTQFRLSFVYILLLNEKILGFNFWSPEIECMITPFVSKDHKKRLQQQPYRELFILGLNWTEHMTVRTGPKAKFAGQHGLSIHLNQCLQNVFSVMLKICPYEMLQLIFPMCLEPRCVQDWPTNFIFSFIVSSSENFLLFSGWRPNHFTHCVLEWRRKHDQNSLLSKGQCYHPRQRG